MLDNVGDALTLTAGKFPHKTAVINDGGSSLTFGQLNERTNKLANALMKLGVKKGDRIAYLFPNTSTFFEVHFAVAKIGAVGVPLNVRLVGRELHYQIHHADAVAVIFHGAFAKTVSSIQKELPTVRHFIGEGCEGEGVLDYETVLQEGDGRDPDVAVGLYDPNVVLYTAGTTGVPKGAVLSHKNSLFNAMAMIMDYGMRHEDVLQVVPPLYHSASLNGFAVTGVLLGATQVLHATVDLGGIFQSIQNHRITFTWGPATLWRMLLAYPERDQYDTSSVRMVINGAMYMPAEMRRAVLAMFPNAAMGDTYGMTEASPCTTILRPEDVLRKPASVGVPLTICDVKIFDDEGREVPPGTVGEIVNRGNFMMGYDKNPEATAQAIRNGWYYTGDLGRKDEEGFIYLVDRKKDMIVTGGENVYSREVEEVIAAHPGVFEAAVVGLPDERWGEKVTAVIVPKPGAPLTEEDVLNHCRQNLAGYKCPKTILFRPELPKSAAGKILKKDIRETLLQSEKRGR